MALLHPEETEKLFLATPLPEQAILALRTFLAKVEDPLVVRSSSILEDSVIHSFAGKYLSTFFGNVTSDLDVRMNAVTTSIKRIYARTFFQKAVSYRKNTDWRDAMGSSSCAWPGNGGRYFYPPREAWPTRRISGVVHPPSR
jgi:phosphoenolpyruvate synthase/pyruvate phosphate dikinase